MLPKAIVFRPSRVRTLSAAVLLLTVELAFAQQPDATRLAIGGSFRRNLASGAIATFAQGTIACGTFERGSANGFDLFAGVSLPLGANGFSFAPLLSFTNLSSDFTIAVDDSVRTYNFTPTPERVTRERTYRTSIRTIGVGVAMEYALSGLTVSAAPWLKLPVSRLFQEEERITSGNAVFTESLLSTIQVREGDVHTPAIVPGLSFGVGYSYTLKNNLILRPLVTADFPLVSMSSEPENSWNMVSLGAGLQIAFDLTSPPIPEPEPPVVVEVHRTPAPVPSRAILTASISAVGLTDDGREIPEPTLLVEKLRITEVLPTLNYIFFDDGMSSIPTRYVQQPLGGAPVLEESSLFAANALEIHHHVLDILGKRLRQDPTAAVTLVGTRSLTSPNDAAQTSALSLARARSVKEYLVSIWGIEPARISIRSRDLPENPSEDATLHGQSENRRVEVIPNKPSIIAPLWTQRVERVATPPRIQFSPDIISEAGVVSATIVVRQREQVLQTFDALTGGPAGEHLWRLTESSMPNGQDSLVYDLLVIDSQGNRAQASGVIRLRQLQRETDVKKADLAKDGRKVEKYSLILFDYSSSQLAHKQADTIIGYVAKNLSPDARLVITGHTDKTGDTQFNERLAMERAQRAVELLRVRLRGLRKPAPTLQVESHGSRDVLFDNSIPEGRFLSRTVRMTLEHLE